jgi:alpha-D-ribose 1-methylphosphonate 5-triphosphate synthase subunit PhnG
VTRGVRSEGLAAAARVRRPDLLALAEEVALAAAVDLVDPPAAASVMLELESSVGTFCLTEVVVTTARVRAGEADGWGCVLGWDAEGALATALCDAAAGARAEDLARHALDVESAARRERLHAVAATKV